MFRGIVHVCCVLLELNTLVINENESFINTAIKGKTQLLFYSILFHGMM